MSKLSPTSFIETLVGAKAMSGGPNNSDNWEAKEPVITEQDGAPHSVDSPSDNDTMEGVSSVEQETSSTSCV